MKKILPLTYSLSILTIILNIVLIIDVAIGDGISNKDFIYTFLILMFSSSQLILNGYSIFNYNVTNGLKSIRKLFYGMLLINWANLLFISLTFIEGINTKQNPLTNTNLIISWIVITLVIIMVKYLDKKYL
ncbi:hypothetical protein ACETAC_05925 [Aceticella autotrophica]|uniref:Uncharacterized protein n=1 Tax=Aceticella autotrophica TaxID=2755338 RepID=A0A975AU70_9THEO|nr:hypothetical protein [Aceticella autotrophica]QSZ26445.1 hypothetical protein ACETAC_05775 [Aceticella autotrophica]QSZ26463.1 hypothetical protein ACETAC_05925 [Aceticella autotrophica]